MHNRIDDRARCLVLRRREPDLAAVSTLGYPFTPAIFILSSVVVLAILGWCAVRSTVTLGWVVLSLAVHQILAPAEFT
jgi:hypothetical protein